jgi:hypothetical protein
MVQRRGTPVDGAQVLFTSEAACFILRSSDRLRWSVGRAGLPLCRGCRNVTVGDLSQLRDTLACGD